MPHKHNAARRHHTLLRVLSRPKMSFKVQNWPAYEPGLRRRGSLTLWIEDSALECWQTIGPSGQARYREAAIQASMMLRTAFKLALRKTEGLMTSVLRSRPTSPESCARRGAPNSASKGGHDGHHSANREGRRPRVGAASATGGTTSNRRFRPACGDSATIYPLFLLTVILTLSMAKKPSSPAPAPTAKGSGGVSPNRRKFRRPPTFQFSIVGTGCEVGLEAASDLDRGSPTFRIST
jgi:hypothetical protein